MRQCLIMLVAAGLLTGCIRENPAKTSPSKTSAAATPPKEKGPVAKKIEAEPDKAKSPSSPNNPVVVIETSMGKIKAELFEDKAPITVKNILGYVDDKLYDGTIFHRVIPDFMIQGGGFEPGMKEKEGKRPPIKNESDNNVKNSRGTLAMARTNDPDSATNQFYINVKDNPNLDRNDGSIGYAVFGQVLEGMNVVDQIRQVQTRRVGPHGDVPVENIMIKSIRRVQ